MADDRTGLYRLLTWLSPGFPIGAYSYSHGLEAAVDSGRVADSVSLQDWVAAVVVHGSGRVDADILRDAYRAAANGALAGLTAVNGRALAYRTTAELACEATAQGEAFLSMCCRAWPDAFLDRWVAHCASRLDPEPRPAEQAPAPPPPHPIGAGICYAAAVGAATARARIPLEDTLVAYMQAMAANLVSAGLRLGIIGQTGGQQILAALEPVVIRAANCAIDRDPADFGAATVALDLASIAHETQYTRLFRS